MGGTSLGTVPTEKHSAAVAGSFAFYGTVPIQFMHVWKQQVFLSGPKAPLH